MLILDVRLQLRFVYARVWKIGDVPQMLPYVPPMALPCPSLVTSDDGTCGNDTITYTLEHGLYNPHIEPRGGGHIGISQLLAERYPCEDTCCLLEFLMGHIRLGAAARMGQGHLLATIRRYTGPGDHIGIIVIEIGPDGGYTLPPDMSIRSFYDPRIDIDIVFMPWWRMVLNRAASLALLSPLHCQYSRRLAAHPRIVPHIGVALSKIMMASPLSRPDMQGASPCTYI